MGCDVGCTKLMGFVEGLGKVAWLILDLEVRTHDHIPSSAPTKPDHTPFNSYPKPKEEASSKGRRSHGHLVSRVEGVPCRPRLEWKRYQFCN